MCHPAADRLNGQAGGNHVLRMPSADYSPTGAYKPSWNLCNVSKAFEWLNRAYAWRKTSRIAQSRSTSRLHRTNAGFRLATIRDLAVLNSVSATASACHQHASHVSLSTHSVIEKLSGAS